MNKQVDGEAAEEVVGREQEEGARRREAEDRLVLPDRHECLHAFRECGGHCTVGRCMGLQPLIVIEPQKCLSEGAKSNCRNSFIKIVCLKF